MLSSNADLAFTNSAEKMLKEKELKNQKKKQVDKIKADWSNAQKDINKAMIDITDSKAKAIKKQAHCAVCWKLKEEQLPRPVTLQDDVNLMFAKTQKFSEQDRLSLLRKVIKVKKLIFLELPNDLFKQYNISSTKMY